MILMSQILNIMLFNEHVNNYVNKQPKRFTKKNFFDRKNDFAIIVLKTNEFCQSFWFSE